MPDVFVRPGPDGGWIVELNCDTLPRVLVNQSYYAEVSATTRRDAEKSYLVDCLQKPPGWCARSISAPAPSSRSRTKSCASRTAFLAHGVQHLRPLNLKTVAEAIGMHKSTVRRVDRQQIHGDAARHLRAEIFLHLGDRRRRWRRSPLGRSGAAPDQAVDRRASATDVLSDDTIVDNPRVAGVDIARRTVAKYREAMRIPSSVQRRREKQAAAVT